MKSKDMTYGKILPQLLLFALPLLGGSLVQQMYNTADLLFVGNFAGKAAAAAVGSSGIIFTCLIGLFTGISVGAGIVVSYAWGAGRKKDAQKTAQTAMVIVMTGSIFLMIAGLIGARKILMFLNTPSAILNDAVIYVRIYFLSMLPMVIYNMGASILRAGGNSKVPFYILIAGGIANILADTLLIVIFKQGVVGAAVATSLSQGVSAIFMLYYLMSKKSPIPLSFNNIKIESHILTQILYLGIPSGIQAVVISLSNLVVQFFINGYGENAVAAYAAYFKIENLIYYPIMACGQAITTFTGQNYGAGKTDRIYEGTKQALISSCLITIILSAIVLIIPNWIVGIFIKDEAVISYGISILMTTFPLYWLYAILEIMGGTMRGMGYSQIAMIIVMVGICGLRIVLLFVIDKLDAAFYDIAKVYPITWGVTAAMFIIAFFIVIKKNSIKKIKIQ